MSAPDDQFVQPLPYHVHFEIDGGTDHRATLFSNHIAYLGLLFIGNMDILVRTCGCLGILYLNTCKRAMLMLNIGLSSLALSLDVGKYEWLMTEFILVAMSINNFRASISEYDLELPKSIKALQRQLIRLQNNAPVTKNPTDLPPLPM